MKIKIIDLLNMIANDEVVPKTIMYYDTVYESDGENKFYYTDNGASLYREFYVNGNCLNEEVEVEIVEEDDEIEKISYTDHIGIDLSEAVCNKINEVIDVVNKLKEDN